MTIIERAEKLVKESEEYIAKYGEDGMNVLTLEQAIERIKSEEPVTVDTGYGIYSQCVEDFRLGKMSRMAVEDKMSNLREENPDTYTHFKNASKEIVNIYRAGKPLPKPSGKAPIATQVYDDDNHPTSY